MDFLQELSKRHPQLFRIGFDRVAAENDFATDGPHWKPIEGLAQKMQEALSRGEHALADKCVDEMASRLRETSWYSYFKSTIQGKVQVAIQDSISGSAADKRRGACQVICIEGGPTAAVEAKLMPEIVKGVHVRGMSQHIEVVQYTLPQARAAIARHVDYFTPWVFVSSPEKYTGDNGVDVLVMDWIQGMCPHTQLFSSWASHSTAKLSPRIRHFGTHSKTIVQFVKSAS